MAHVNINDLSEKHLTDAHLTQVKGGPAYIKFDGVDGEVQGVKPRPKYGDITLKKG